MDLRNHATHARTILSDDDEQIFCDEPHVLESINDLDMGESLAVGAHFILAFDDEYPAFSQDA
jgi:hypothetical protein